MTNRKGHFIHRSSWVCINITTRKYNDFTKSYLDCFVDFSFSIDEWLSAEPVADTVQVVPQVHLPLQQLLLPLQLLHSVLQPRHESNI